MPDPPPPVDVTVSAPREALSGGSGRGHSDEADERRNADGDRADDGEDGLPSGRRHRHLGDAVRGAVAGDGRGRKKEQDEKEASPRQGEKGKHNPPNAKGPPPRHETHGNAAEDTG